MNANRLQGPDRKEEFVHRKHHGRSTIIAAGFSLTTPKKIVLIQTAFLGDVILTLPLVQAAKKVFPESQIDFVSVPRAAPVLRGHPAVTRVIEFDKRGTDKGIAGLWRLSKKLQQERYDVALVPHRSLRSALLVTLSKIPVRVGFDTSNGRWFLTDTVPYRKDIHEIDRNISLLGALNVHREGREFPGVYPSDADRMVVDELLQEISGGKPSLIAIAPGTVWNTKRWLKERFAELAQRFIDDGMSVVLIGGSEDRELCDEIMAIASTFRTNSQSSGRASAPGGTIINTAGRLSFLQSAELLGRCRLLVSNDSAPMHLAVAMRTPVVAIFGATVPEFGFAPYGEHDVVVETKGLECRPCSIHGGEKCPIKTFVCMESITSELVYRQSWSILSHDHG